MLVTNAILLCRTTSAAIRDQLPDKSMKSVLKAFPLKTPNRKWYLPVREPWPGHGDQVLDEV